MTDISQIVPDGSRKVIMIGCFPPRRCGIATFTKDTVDALRSADPKIQVSVLAIADGDKSYKIEGPVFAHLRQGDGQSYIDAAALINRERPDCVIVQHEFGIFGGPAGEYLLTLLALIKVPVVTFFHTILETPDYDQMRVMRRLIYRSSQLVVMAQRGARILRDVYGAAGDRVTVIPHGAPVRSYVPPKSMRESLGLQGERLISTFGLLSPNKGIENVIRALPEVLSEFPSTKYAVIGVTHPHLVAKEGEVYRASLEKLAADLGLRDNVVFVNKFVDNDELLDFLQASDVYVTPYLNEAQITSGALSYALAMGSYVISTPYWHAQEVLAECPGQLVPVGESDPISDALISAFKDEEVLDLNRRIIHQWAEHTTWPAFGQQLLGVVEETLRGGNRLSHISERQGPAYPAIALKAVERMTDECGIFQHSRFGVPDRDHGYCVDDNARALIMVNDIIRRGMIGADIERLHTVYAGFVLHTYNTDNGRFRNFMGFDRRWDEKEPCEDSQGRTFWALGHAAATSQYSGNHGWAATLIQQAMEQARQITSPRAMAFVILGCAEIAQSEHRAAVYDSLMNRFAARLSAQYLQMRSDQWDWLEDTLSYDNGRIPQAMIAAARLSGDQALLRSGLASLNWLCDIQMVDHGMFAPVGSESFFRVRQPPLPCDQQPIEAAAMLDACYQAFLATHDRKWWRRAKTIFAWYYGLNSHNLSLVNPVTGQCHDGLNRSGLNLNMGAESLLAFQMAICTYQAFVEQADSTSRSDTRDEKRQFAQR